MNNQVVERYDTKIRSWSWRIFKNNAYVYFYAYKLSFTGIKCLLSLYTYILYVYIHIDSFFADPCKNIKFVLLRCYFNFQIYINN